MAQEPQYVVQTAEAEHLGNPTGWYEAHERMSWVMRGCKVFRRSSKPCGMLLLEAWREQPTDMGEERWSLAA